MNRITSKNSHWTHCRTENTMVAQKTYLFTTRCYASAVSAIVMCTSLRLSQAGIVQKPQNR